MQAIPRPTGVILDLDGTLVDTVETRIAAWMQTFAEEGMPAERRFVAALIGSDGRRLAREVGREAATPMDEARAERIDARAGRLYSELNTDPRPLPGVTQFLDALEAARVPWAIATSSRRDQVGPSVDALRRSSPPRIVDGSSVRHAKPDPELLLAAAAALDLPPAACWCIGDSTWDMRAAVAARMTPIGVLAGSAVEGAELSAAGAALTVGRIDELLPVLDGVAG